MEVVFRFSVFPTFQPDETILYSKPRIWLASFKSLPSYRIHVPIPVLVDMGFYVTDRRLVFVAVLLGCVYNEYSLWYPGKAARSDVEVLRSAAVGRTGMLGECLELKSDVSEKIRFRGREMRSRIYMKDARKACEILARELDEGNRFTSQTLSTFPGKDSM